MGVAIAVLALLVSLAGLAFSVLSFLARNRPYVGIRSLEVHSVDRERSDLVMDVENVGEVPAVDVRIEVKDQAEMIEEPSVIIGALFPRQSDAEGRERKVEVFPEGGNVALVSCKVQYQRPSFLGFIPERTYETHTYFRVSRDGYAEPARSQISTIA